MRRQIDSATRRPGAAKAQKGQEPKTGYEYFVRGQLSTWDRDFSSAIADFTAAIEHGESVGLSLQYRGACKLFLGDQMGAAADFQRANELAQNSGLLYFFRGVLRHIGRDCAGALSDYAEAVRLNPNPTPGARFNRRSAIDTIYDWHAEWFAASVTMLSRVDDDISVPHGCD